MVSLSGKDCALAVSVLLLCASIGIVIWLGIEYDKSLNASSDDPPITPSTTIDLKRRINCFPEQQGTSSNAWDITESQCLQRGCRYNQSTRGDNYVPICYMHPDDIGYKLKSVDSTADWYLSLTLETISSKTVFDPPISPITFKARILNNQHLQIKIEDPSNKRYEVPVPLNLQQDSTATETTADFEVTYANEPFSFQVRRKATGKILFDSSMGGFIFSNRFLQLTSVLPSENFYGIGEQEHTSLKHDLNYKTWPIFGRDQGGLGVGSSLYGAQPFYMVLEEDGNSHGVFVFNSNAMDYTLIPTPGVIIRTIGGILDVHFTLGPTPSEVVQQHTNLVGRPFIPPYWSLGFHLSKYNYYNLSNMQAAVERTREAEIPLDVIYADIDHMDERKDFTIDEVKFGGLADYFEQERTDNGLRSIIILDPAIPDPPTKDYEPWKAFDDKNAWITWPNDTTMMGYVWPVDKVAFPDFFLQEAKDVWAALIKNHSEILSFDGLWIDMNEPANFGTNEDKPFNWPNDWEPWSLKCGTTEYDDPPYKTWAAIHWGKNARLSDKTLCMVAKQNKGEYIHYDVHNLYGWTETKPTVDALQAAYPGRRGFVLSRSTFAGSGQYAAHWLGDNLARWSHMYRSIVGMLEFSMFGIADTGPDICGFMEQAWPELCLRWQQLGAFYPYSRNHNDIDSTDQDPAAMGEDVALESKEYMLMRYRVLPYMYTLFYHAHQRGTTVARPLFFEFPTDQATWAIDAQFMLGSAFMVAPLITAGEHTVTAYVPEGTWFNFAKKLEFIDHCGAGTNKRFDVNGTVFLQRGGSIVPVQSTTVSNPKIVTTKQTRLNPMSLDVVLDCDGKAQGSLFWDDGDSKDTVENGKYLFSEYEANIDSTGRLSFVNTLATNSDTTVAGTLAYESVRFFGKQLTAISTVECKDAVSCPSVSCGAFDTTLKTFTCDFGGSGMPITNSFTLDITFA